MAEKILILCVLFGALFLAMRFANANGERENGARIVRTIVSTSDGLVQYLYTCRKHIIFREMRSIVSVYGEAPPFLDCSKKQGDRLF